ncbi:MAG: hypothetical protein FD173_1783 [Gallionellaceae bacterium]|nr:MAG: hypothetical protein FD173_1783 [Gallionellaceae bacterium]
MAKHIVGLLTGLIFGFGLALSGMTQPEKVLGFLDMAGRWDPSLLFVLGGAVGVTVISFRFILRRKKPVLDSRYYFSDETHIDRSLVIGAVLFGVGWGIGGYCPGPAVTLLAAPSWELWAFLPAMLLGIFLQKFWAARREEKNVVDEVAEQNDCS